MTSKIARPVYLYDLSTARWWWKERHPLKTRDVLDEVQSEKAGNEGEASRESIKEQWHQAQRFPSEVHVELLERKVIPHPYVGFNEHAVQWVGETEWLYLCSFDAPEASDGLNSITELAFEGLDTLCMVYLNSKKILETDNAFRGYTYRTAASSGAILPKDNILLLHFHCAKSFAKEQEAIYGKVRAGSTNLGDPSRVYLRKPQYDWRWDWGPELMTCGPYRPITISTYNARIADLNPIAALAGGSRLSLEIKYTLHLTPELHASLKDSHRRLSVAYILTGLQGGNMIKLDDTISVVEGVEVVQGESASEAVVVHIYGKAPLWNNLEEKGFEPWWPVGYGRQNRYRLEAKLFIDGDDEVVVLDAASKVVGFRSVELIQEPLEEPDQYGTGTTFYFRINGVDVFMGGSNWIPADNFLTTISESRYRQWLELLRDGGQNMVRIWGGGIYEPGVFYDLCDELGILVWQDFQFACGVYPAHSSFVASVDKEAAYNVKRLRHHPSLALWCGNNEDYQMILQWGDVSQFPAIVIYEELLPKVVGKFMGTAVPYVRGSPYGGKGWDTADPTVGDVHQWNIWGGKELPWQEYGRLGGRFVSEFGIPAWPSMKTVDYWMEGVDPKERYAQSKIMAQHTRAGAFERRFAIVMNENFRLTADLEKHAFNTQVMQAEALGFSYRIWRREWRGIGKRYCGGVLVWQFNDCWPVVSWSLVDYFLRPKPSYYIIKRELAPLVIGVEREVIQDRPNDRPKQFYEYGATRSQGAKVHIWASRTSPSTAPLKIKLDIRLFDLENPGWGSTITSDAIFELTANGTTELGVLDLPEPPAPTSGAGYSQPGTTATGRVVVLARLLDVDSGEVLARYVDWPQPYRLLDIPSVEDAGVSVALAGGQGSQVRVSVKRPVKCLWLYDLADVEGDASQHERPAKVGWSDNAIDLVPGEDAIVTVRGVDLVDGDVTEKIGWRILQN